MLKFCKDYLEQLPISENERKEIFAHLKKQNFKNPKEAMLALHKHLADRNNCGEEIPSAYGSIYKRLQLSGDSKSSQTPEVITYSEIGIRLMTAPKIKRTTMAPKTWPYGHHGKKQASNKVIKVDSPDSRGHWYHLGLLRRIVLLLLVISQTALGAYFMQEVLPQKGQTDLEILTLVLFSILFCWVSLGFWTACAGFVIKLFGDTNNAVPRNSLATDAINKHARTAIIMPICNEDVPRVFAGLRATYESLAKIKEAELFDFFVLSDSNDPDCRVAEKEAWMSLCSKVNGFGKIFYRWRQHRIKRKSGNIADFCRRWGKDYRYMVILDADSIMTGDCLKKLVQLMEANPNAGIIQTAPKPIGRETLYARIQQFASSVYGPLFVAGLRFWQLGESHYWGHNAIIRMAPFIKHCALGRLPGRGILSGEILSHDFVEAALIRRAGWAVWIADDLDGSYEELPPNLIDELGRDRRWCQGNLINFRLFTAPGIHPAHRAVFFTGAMAYMSALLWFMFLIISTAMAALYSATEPEYFTQRDQLFPNWPMWDPLKAISLFFGTATLLFLPKIFGVILVMLREPKKFGGRINLLISMLGEMIFSTLLAPVRMLFHVRFVVAGLLNFKIEWRSPPRGDSETSWKEAFQRHGFQSLFAIAWGAYIYSFNPSFLWWLLPIVGPLALSIPISVFSSRVSLGVFLKKLRLFLIPEEFAPPKELTKTNELVKNNGFPKGFLQGITNPFMNAVLCATASLRTKQTKGMQSSRKDLITKALNEGPNSLTLQEKNQLQNDPIALSQLHVEVWSCPNLYEKWIKNQKRDVVQQPADTKLSKDKRLNPAHAT